MGGEASVARDPYPTEKYPDSRGNGWRVGDITNQPNTCGILGQAGRENKCYKSGEWADLEPIEHTGCCYVSAGDNKGVEFKNGRCVGCTCNGCDGGCLFNGGGPIRCQLKEYKADKVECALTGVNPQNRDSVLYTCNPEWLPGGRQNVPIIAQYCGTGDNFFNDKRCVEFCTKNDCTALVNTKCTGDRVTTEACKKMCFSNTTKYDCSSQLLDHCKLPENQSEDVCQCFLPTEVYDQYYQDLFGGKAEHAQAVINQINKLPACSFTACSTGQYKPRGSGQETCPIQSICVQKIQINNYGEIYFNGDAEFQQTCEQILGVGSNPPPFSEAFPTWAIVLIVVSIVIAIIAAVIVTVVIVRNVKSKNSRF